MCVYGWMAAHLKYVVYARKQPHTGKKTSQSNQCGIHLGSCLCAHLAHLKMRLHIEHKQKGNRRKYKTEKQQYRLIICLISLISLGKSCSPYKIEYECNKFSMRSKQTTRTDIGRRKKTAQDKRKSTKWDTIITVHWQPRPDWTFYSTCLLFRVAQFLFLFRLNIYEIVLIISFSSQTTQIK